MDEFAAIALFLIFIVFRAFITPRRQVKQRKDYIPYPPVSTKEPDLYREKNRVQEPEETKSIAYSYSGISPSDHGEDSIVHDHWTAANAYAFHDHRDEQALTADARDADRIQVGENTTTPDRVHNNLNPSDMIEINAHGMVKAVIMQEILRRPKSLLRQRENSK